MTVKQRPVKLLAPKVAEAKYIGGEPTWEKVDRRPEQLLRAMNWYNYTFGKKDAREFIADWLDRNGRFGEAKKVKVAADPDVRTVIGWLCRVNIVGLELTDRELKVVNDDVARLVAIKEKVAPSVDEVKPATNRPNIQDRLREKMSACAAEIEGLFDDFILDGCKLNSEMKIIQVIRAHNVMPNLIVEMKDHWEKRLAEFTAVREGKDQDLVEGYANYGKLQIRGLIKFAEQVVADCGTYVQIKKVERKPRKKKPVSAEKLVQRLKYLKEFKDLGLVSESPTKLVGASEAWMYDTKKRKLMHYVADQHVGSFTVKGNTLIGIDTTQSTGKTLRKPAEQIKGVMGGKPAARKFYAGIKAVEAKLTGRFNDGIVILRAY